MELKVCYEGRNLQQECTLDRLRIVMYNGGGGGGEGQGGPLMLTGVLEN